MIRLSLVSASLVATLLAAGLHAQAASPRCPGAEANDDGIQISVSLAAHPTRIASVVDSILARDGYVVQSRPAGAGRWQIEPRFTYLQEVKEEAWVREPHPGVQLAVRAEARGDSTRVQIGARMLCQPDPAMDGAENVESVLELLTAARLATGLTGSLDTLRAAGVDLAAAVQRSEPVQLMAPDALAGFRRIGRRDYDDPAAGVSIRYGRDNGCSVDIYVYPGTPPDCDAACGARAVNEEADGFVRDFPELIRRGYYRRMDVRADETVPVPAGARWLFGRHLVMEVEANGAAQASHYYLFAFPGYKVKVRATFRPSAEMTAAVQAFVDALLPAMASGG